MPNIRIENENKPRGLNKVFIKRIAAKVLRAARAPRNTELEIVFLTDKKIREFNKKFLKENRATDVLSFDLSSGVSGKSRFIGEILISSDTAFKNSKIFGTRFEEELVLYIIHGILHLFGYDDTRPKDAKRMSKKQEGILKTLCTITNLSKALMPR
jgi:probable rRNA maturation factor